MWPNPQETAYLVTFTEEILNGKLHFFCSVGFWRSTQFPPKLVIFTEKSLVENYIFWEVWSIHKHAELVSGMCSTLIKITSMWVSLRHCQGSMIKLLRKLFNNFQTLTFFVKNSKIEVWQGLKDAPENNHVKVHNTLMTMLLLHTDILPIATVLRSSHQRCSMKKGVFENFAKFTGKHLSETLF